MKPSPEMKKPPTVKGIELPGASKFAIRVPSKLRTEGRKQHSWGRYGCLFPDKSLSQPAPETKTKPLKSL